MFKIFNNSTPIKPIDQIIQAVRILAKKETPAVIVVDSNQDQDISISSSEIIEKIKTCPRASIKIDLSKVKSVNCLFPFPSKVARADLTDQELVSLGASQQTNGAVVSISQSGKVAVYHQNSIRRDISINKLFYILTTILNIYQAEDFVIRKLKVFKAKS